MNSTQAFLSAHADALRAAAAARLARKHDQAAQLELVALLLRCKLGHAPSLLVSELLQRVAAQPVALN